MHDAHVNALLWVWWLVWRRVVFAFARVCALGRVLLVPCSVGG